MEGAWRFCLGIQLPSEMLYSKHILVLIMHQGFRAYDGSGGGIESPEKKTFFYFAVD